MHRDRTLSRRKLSIKELLNSIFLKKSSTSNDLVQESIEEYSQNSSSSGMTCCSCSTLKRYEEVKKDQRTSPYSTLVNQQSEKPVSAYSGFFYSPLYRRYFGLTPPNPRLYNRELLRDYIDWYMNVYLQEGFPWRRIQIVSVAEKLKQDEEASKFALNSLTSSNHRL